MFRDLPSTATAKKRCGQLTSENDGGHQEASKENSTLGLDVLHSHLHFPSYAHIQACLAWWRGELGSVETPYASEITREGREVLRRASCYVETLCFARAARLSSVSIERAA